ncbi:transposase family protein [Micromonospora sp. NPDC005252]|uniref:helix-turn-helix domain-containing protein n=1 Tax=Micromonospora sp. NPDC005252 TaxID=3364228 RepID=UPI0036AC41ED
MTNRRLTGLSRSVIEGLVSELRPRWRAQHRDRLASRIRRRRIGAGARHRFGFVDRLLATLVHLRHGLTHDVIAAWFGVHRSTISRSIAEISPPAGRARLPGTRRCPAPDPLRRGGPPRTPPAGVDGRHRSAGAPSGRGPSGPGPVRVRQGPAEHHKSPGDL